MKMRDQRESRAVSQIHCVLPLRPLTNQLMLGAFVFGVAVGCRTIENNETVRSASMNSGAAPSSTHESDTNAPARVSEQSVLAVLWFQWAAECRALYYQACNIARQRIHRALR
jgi:hypothetical protein